MKATIITVHFFILSLLFLALSPVLTHAHERGPRGAVTLDWQSAHISRVVSPVFVSNNLGYASAGPAGSVVVIDGKSCLQGSQFSIDIKDEYLFDLAAGNTVVLELEFYQQAGSADSFSVAYDINGGIDGIIQQDFDKNNADSFHRQSLLLHNARFINRGHFGSDLFLVGGKSNGAFALAPSMTVCDINIVQPASLSSKSTETGRVEIAIVDESGQVTPARVGVYDSDQRLIFSPKQTVALRFFDEIRPTLRLPAHQAWPHSNPYVFYSSGQYAADLPVGGYEVVINKGPEYKMQVQEFRVDANSTLQLPIQLERWRDLPQQGWYSGDVHIHATREDEQASATQLLHTSAEDVHVSSLLQMGNIAHSHYEQPSWGSDGRVFGSNDYYLVNGQEDPRSDTRGHTSHLNLRELVRFPEQYLLYHLVFEEVQTQNGISGYAHTHGYGSGVREGMAIDIPFGLVDFVEVMQSGSLYNPYWFDFLNLGYRLAPAGGTDYPYLDDVIGAVRSYVHVEGEFSTEKWFANLAAGKTFVSNGPVIDFKLNGALMGSTVEVSREDEIKINATVSINPDIDTLDRIELIEQGRVIATQKSIPGAETLTLNYQTKAEAGSWYLIRAIGKKVQNYRGIGAYTAPIYLSVDGSETWQKDSVDAIATTYINLLLELRDNPPPLDVEGESWWTRETWVAQREQQIELLNGRIDQAIVKLENRIIAASAN